MRFFAALVITLLLAPTLLRADPQQTRVATVYVWSFRIGPIAGLTEADIARAGCKGWIDKKTFLGFLKPRRPTNYDRTNVRAEILFSPSDIYFVDADGRVRSVAGGLYSLSGSDFQRAVRFSKKCRKAPL